MSVSTTSYELRTEDGAWIGHVVLTSNGCLMSVTDWGNFSFGWTSWSGDFREFISGLEISYFAGKMYQGISYVANGRAVEKSAMKFAEKILPPLQVAIRKEIEAESRPKPIFDPKAIKDIDVTEPNYVIGTSTGNEHELAYCMNAEVDNVITVVISKTMKDRERFDQEVNSLSEIFGAKVISIN